MNGEKPLTGVRKRAQIASANQQMLIWVAVAAVVLVVCVMLAINLIQQITYQMKVNGRLSDTANTMETNINNISGLTSEVDKLNSNQNLNLPNLKSDDSTPLQVVLDALPTEDDRVSLGASLQKKILLPSGVNIQQISVTDSGAGATTDTVAGSTVSPTAQPITFSVVIVGSYDTIQTALKDIERTIRPFTITQLSLQGTDDNLQATINATTYFVPKVNWTTGTETVPVGDEPVDTNANSDADTTGGEQ